MYCKVKAPKQIKTHQVNTTFWTRSRIIFSTTYMTLLMIGGNCTLKSLVSSLSQPISVFPTSIPWIHTESHCEHTNRVWREEQCWDYEHNMTF